MFVRVPQVRIQIHRHDVRRLAGETHRVGGDRSCAVDRLKAIHSVGRGSTELGNCYTTEMRLLKFVIVLSLVSACASSARATVLYSFSLTPTVEYDNNLIEGFSFSFLAPTYITSGESATLTAFNITDGTYSATISNGIAFNYGTDSCFSFSSATNVSIGSTCSALYGYPAGVVTFRFPNQALPSADGTYTSPVSTATFVWDPSDADDYSQGPGVLIVSTLAAPEPTSVILVGTALLGIAFAARKRMRGSRSL